MDLLNGIMKDYGSKESSYNFTTFKYNLKAVCNASTELFLMVKIYFRTFHFGCGHALLTSRYKDDK